jgi:hypothetical protein
MNVNGSVVFERNRIVKLSDAMQEYNARQNELYDAEIDENGNPVRSKPVLKYVEGGSMNSIWAVPSLGLDPETGQEVFVGADGLPTYFWAATNEKALADNKEKYRGNFGFNGEWKGIGFNLTCRFLGGGYRYNQTLVDRIENANLFSNVDRRVLTGRWTTENRDALYKSFRVKNEDGQWIYAPNTRPSSRFIQKRNDLSIASISAYYDLARLRTIENMGFNRLRLGINMNEVHTFSTIGIERGTSYPFARTVSLSLTAEF